MDSYKFFATIWLVDHQARFGFSISSDEMKLFKHLAIASNAMNTVENQEPFTQRVADKVDHKVRILAGKETFLVYHFNICLFESKISLSKD